MYNLVLNCTKLNKYKLQEYANISPIFTEALSLIGMLAQILRSTLRRPSYVALQAAFQMENAV